MRSILSVVVGYVALAIFVMTFFTVSYFVIGPDRVYEVGSYEPSNLWILISFVLGFAGAVLGGWVCSIVARESKPPLVLAGVVLFLGLVFAVPALLSEDTAPEVREAGVEGVEAIRTETQPDWVTVLNPFVGAAGVLLGARLRRRGGRPE